MSKIDELLKNEKVEWKKLGEVCDITTGKLNANDKVDNGKYLFFTTAQEISYIDKYAFDGESLLIAGNANVGDVKYYNGKFNAYQRVYVLQNFRFIKAKFLMHFMKAMLKRYLETKKNQSAMTYIVLKDLKNFEIPVPSIEKQNKIIEMLDGFTDYVFELNSELESRVKQYEYYRDKLLSEKYIDRFKNELSESEKFKALNYLKLEDLVNIIVGSDVPKNNFSKTKNEKYKIPIYSNGTEENSLYGYTDTAKVFEDSVTISARGTIGYVSLKNEPYYPIVRLICLIPKNKFLNIKFLYYFLQQYKFSYVHTGIPSLTSDMVKNIKMPLPNIIIQNKIVGILDKFQSLLSETEGLLPREIELRQKQYEYYREQLLNFYD